MKLYYLIILFVLLSITSVFVGVTNVSPLDLFSLTEAQERVLIESRIPRVISIIIAGAAMSVCGLIMQQLTRNKFVSPTTAGTMDWARLGILISLIFSQTLVQL